MKLYNNEYRATKNWPYAISAGTVVYRIKDGKTEVLLLKRKAGDFPHLRDGHLDTYHLPKGHVSIGETLEQTALRETAEEAGCEVVLTTYLGTRLHQYTEYNGIIQDKTIHYFAGEWRKSLSGHDSEHSETTWVPLSEAAKLLGDTNPKKEHEIITRLEKFLELTK